MGGDLTYRYEGGHSIFELSLPLEHEAAVVARQPSDWAIG